MTRKNVPSAPVAAAKRAAVYTRKSTSQGLEQDFNSLDAQREACEHYIAAQANLGWQLMPDRFDDGGFTGANLERPAFARLLADIDAGRVDVVVVYKVDRLSRSLLDFARVMDRFNRAGVAFVSVTQNFSTADAMGRLTLNMLMSFAEFEREMIAERTRDKIAASRRRGKWTGGRLPLGYDLVEKKLVVNDLEALVVREAFRLYLEHRSVLAVAKLLNAEGRMTKRHHAKNGRTQDAKRWEKNGVLRVLRNPVYAGYIPCGDELHEGEHEPIVDRDTFARTRAILGGFGPKTDYGRNPDYLLRGLLWCARCKKMLTPASTRKGGREYRYYRCVTRDKQGAKACLAQPLPARAIESFVVGQIRRATSDATLAAAVAARAKERAEEQRKGLVKERDALPRSIAALSDEGTKLVDTLTEVTGPARRLLDIKLEKVGQLVGQQEARLAEVERRLAAIAEMELEAGWVAQVLAELDGVWDALTVENRSRLVRAVIDRIEVDEPKGEVKVRFADLGKDAGDTEQIQPTAAPAEATP